MHQFIATREPAIILQLGDIGHTIQLAVAPVFLLTGVGSNLVVLTNRLARIIDRTRTLEQRYPTAAPAEQARMDAELDHLHQRSHLIHRAITLSTASALLVCVVVAALFIADAINVDLAKPIAAMFVLAMFSLIGSFICFLREIFVATSALTPRRSEPARKSDGGA